MTLRGGTLLQVHYHNRPGGVTTVMRLYAEAFSRACRGVPHANIILCSAAVGAATLRDVGHVFDVKECDYHVFRGYASFGAARTRIMQALSLIIDERTLPRPVVIAGHNMNLGKNCALSCAFADAARHYSGARGDLRFFSVVHDFAEEGRFDLLQQIQKVRGFGVDIWNDLYPSVKSLHFVTPNARNRSLLKMAGYPVTLLRNPVAKPKAGAHRGKAIRARLRAAMHSSMREVAKKENAGITPARSILLYPSRVISRKNPVEAVLVAHVMLKSCLLFGATGTSSNDRSLAAGLKALCRKCGVPVMFDAGRIPRRIVPQYDSFQLLYEIADMCITTSIAEGFGYAIHEPALFGKKIIGRFPDGFTSSEERDFPHLYKRLLVPSTWVNMEKLKRRYYHRLTAVPGRERSLPAFGSFSGMFDRTFTKGDGVDFGCLDATTQIDILKRCLQSPGAVKEWKQAFPFQTKRLMTLFHSKSGGRTKSAVVSHAASFEESFVRCYFRNNHAVRPRYEADPKMLLRHFCSCEHFRLLMTPERVGDTAVRTVFA